MVSACSLDQDLVELPNNDLTIIGDRASTSATARRREWALARALYTKAHIMLLDDPLSAVDSHVGNTLFNDGLWCCESLFEKGGSAPRKRIVILVTHQIQFLSSPRVDRVVVMDQGRITATGSYTELVEQGKLEFVGSGGAEEEGAKRAMSLSGEVLPVKPDRALQQASANESTQSLGIDSDLGSPAVSSDDPADARKGSGRGR